MKIRIGTRKSKLAIVQTNMVIQALKASFPDVEVEIVHIITQGDVIMDKPLTQFGGKGLFITEFEKALTQGEIDMAVHSAKDLPVELAEGLEIAGVLPRGNYRDVLVTRKEKPIINRSDFVVGTSSMRRSQGIKKLYPMVSLKDIRGNVDTRLGKLLSGQYDAIVLAAAGLERLGLYCSEDYDVTPFECRELMPAPCQGIVAMECLKDGLTAEYIKKINHNETYLSFLAERSVPQLLMADCGTPVGAYSYVENGWIHMFVSTENDKIMEGKMPAYQGRELARKLVSRL